MTPSHGDPSRRDFLHGLAGAALTLAGCGAPAGPSAGSARLTVRLHAPSKSVTPGALLPVDLPNRRESALYIPSSYTPAAPLPFVLALHGAGIGATGPINFLGPYAEEHGFFLLAVGSRDSTWDVIHDDYGPDIGFINPALEWAFERCAIDPTRLVVEGFSDGATYALALALVNGDLFRRVVAFSPGYVPTFDDPLHGDPEFFVSHGRQDPVLRIDCASRRIVPALEAASYEVTYREYDGVHSIPPDIATQAVQWLTATRPTPASAPHPFTNPGPCIIRPD